MLPLFMNELYDTAYVAERVKNVTLKWVMHARTVTAGSVAWLMGVSWKPSLLIQATQEITFLCRELLSSIEHLRAAHQSTINTDACHQSDNVSVKSARSCPVMSKYIGMNGRLLCSCDAGGAADRQMSRCLLSVLCARCKSRRCSTVLVIQSVLSTLTLTSATGPTVQSTSMVQRSSESVSLCHCQPVFNDTRPAAEQCH